ncbi:MAG: hypothetical protein KF690_08990 [Bacteroidetes bacterium]|nr:hypothetical protein [Bacteroidota bacterium]
MKATFLWALLVLLLTGCGVRISDYDRQWNPYHKGQTLIFQNEKGNQYHLYVVGAREMRDHVARSFRTEPSLVVYASSYEGAKMHRKDMPPSFLHITRSSVNAPASLQLTLTDYRFATRFVQTDPMQLELEALKQQFNDVILLKNERPAVKDATTLQATQVWWSRKQGLLAFELDNGSKFTLISIEERSGK